MDLRRCRHAHSGSDRSIPCNRNRNCNCIRTSGANVTETQDTGKRPRNDAKEKGKVYQTTCELALRGLYRVS